MKTYTAQFDDGEIRRATHAEMIQFFQGMAERWGAEDYDRPIDRPGVLIGDVEDWDFENHEPDINLHGEYDPHEMLAWILADK